MTHVLAVFGRAAAGNKTRAEPCDDALGGLAGRSPQAARRGRGGRRDMSEKVTERPKGRPRGFQRPLPGLRRRGDARAGRLGVDGLRGMAATLAAQNW